MASSARLILPYKSVFLFDPLLILLTLLVVGSWQRVRPIVRLWLGALLGSFLTYLLLYSRHAFWGCRRPAWGCRYHLTPVWFLCLVTLPVLRRCGIRWAGRVTSSLRSSVWQSWSNSLSLVFHYYLESPGRTSLRRGAEVCRH